MPVFDSDQPMSPNHGCTRRDFLHAGSAAALGLAHPNWIQAAPERDINCILLVLVGGPSQLDSWDPKPAAPVEVRGPFRPIATKVPSIQISELFPRMAQRADKFTLIRSVHHPAPLLHDTGHQLMQTGRLFSGGIEHPHLGCVLHYLKGPRGPAPAHVLLPGPIGRTGGNQSHGQSAGYLGTAYDPVLLPTNAMRPAPQDRYGQTRFGQDCLLARRLIEQGVRCVTVNMFDTVFDEITWDIHGCRPFTRLTEMADRVAPVFDQAFSALLDDLHERGLLSTTIVAAVSEFGRTPQINAAGGRDHHPGVWTIVLAGGPFQGGRVIGESDEWGFQPKSRPVTPAEVVATLYRGLGLDPHGAMPGPNQQPLPLVEAGVEAMGELF